MTPIDRGGRAGNYNDPTRTHHRGSTAAPPPTYICHRCGQGGHFINHCPTNGDPKYDFVRVKNSTGIPKTFLVPVSASEAALPGTLLTPGGGLAKVAPNE